MKIKLYASSGIFENNVIMDGFTLNGYLTLFQDPDQELEAATKRYVDGFPQALSTDQIVSSEIPKRLILGGFGGDLMGFNGTDAYLSPTGVAADTYNQVTVNDKGRVTAAQKVTETNTTVHFSNLVDTPTTAAGYVSDTSAYAVKNAGVASEVTFSGALHSSAAVVANTSAVNRQYVINALGGMVASELPVGSFKMSTSENAGAKYLRANGGVLDKSAYAALYAVIGDTFNDDGFGFMGQPWRQQYAFNTEQSADITGWTTGPSLPATVHWSQAIVTKNRVYLLGGLVSGSESSTVYTAPILPDGTLGTWSTGTSLPTTVYGSQAIVTKNRVYLLGGRVGGSESSTVYTAPILSDGTLGPWTTGTSLPGKVAYSQAIVTKNRVYLLGGGGSSTVHTAPILSDGTLGTWTTGTSLPVTLMQPQAIVTKNRVYLLGGYSGVTAISTVYTAPILSDGTLGSWTTGTSLPATVVYSHSVVTKNRVYLLGGSSSSTVYAAPILPDGTLGPWTTGTSLPGQPTQSQPIVTKNRVYLLGWTNSSTVYTAPFSGGTNDYLTLIDDSIIDTSTQFKLPDLAAKSFDSFDYYIKALP